MYNAFLYVITNEGVDTSSSYSFQGKVCINSTWASDRVSKWLCWCIHSVSPHNVFSLHTQQTSCIYDDDYRGAYMSGTVQIKSGSETYLKAAVASAGPVSVAVDGKSNAFRVCNIKNTSALLHT